MLKRHALIWILVMSAAGAVIAADGDVTLRSSGLQWGPGIFLKHSWASVSSTVHNPSDRPAEVLLLTSVDKEPKLQFGTTVWLPPHSRRRIVQPIHMPNIGVPDKFVGEDITTIAIDTRGGAERQLDRQPGMVTAEFRPVNFAMFADYRLDNAAMSMVRFQRPAPPQPPGQPPKSPTSDKPVRLMQTERAPTFAGGWDAVDCVIISLDEPHFTADQVEALRRWINGGGILWLFGEQVSREFCAKLLREDWTIRLVDHVQWNDLTIESSRDSHVVSLEDPVDMARVIAPDFTVHHTVAGWPVSMTKSVGQGMLLVTTLGARAWIDEDENTLPQLEEINRLLPRQHVPIGRSELPLEAYAKAQIGYEIINRRSVGLVLWGFVGLVALSGLWLARRDRLEHQALVVVGLALGSAALITAMGTTHHQAVPPTVAAASMAEIDPVQRYAKVVGVEASYSPMSAKMPIIAEANGLIWPQLPDSGGRMIWSDTDRWQWQLPELPPGMVRMSQVQQILPLEDVVDVTISFGADQLTGRITPGPLKNLHDPVLATLSGHLLPRLTGDGGLVIPTDQRPRSDQYFDGGVALSDMQSRHQEIYRLLLSRPVTPQQPRYAQRPTFLAWSDPLDLGFSTDEQITQRRRMLVAIPARFVRPEPGTVITIPTPLIGIHQTRGRDGRFTVTAFDERTRQWDSMRAERKLFVLRFQLPVEAAPLQIQAAPLRVQIDAPNWRLRLLDPSEDVRDAARREDTKALEERVNPVGTVEFDLAKWPQYAVDAAAGIDVMFEVARTPQTEIGSFWTLHGMELTVRGQVQ